MTTRVQALDFSANLTRALLWEYNKAPILTSLVLQKNAWYQTNQVEFWQNWVRDVFDIRTCNEFGLEVWAIILNQPISAPIGSASVGHTWGFGTFHRNFNRGNFASSPSAVAFLTTEQKRLLLRLRYYQLISRGTIPQINRALKDVLGSNGQGYVLDGGNMTMMYVFKLPPGSPMFAILRNYDILPRPATVNIKYRTRTKTFGFGSFHRNFNNGTFLS